VPIDILVDFNDLEEGSRTRTLLRFAEQPSEVHVGATVRAIDADGNSCRATVINIDSDIVMLALDMTSFQPAV
jgi:hypothetical protein